MQITEIDQAQREQLLLEHLPQVHHVARRIHRRLPPQVPIEDLVHAGILGLMDAVRKYDPSKKVQLKYYAEFRIRGAILDSLRLADWSPRALRRQGRRLEQAIALCKGRLGRDPNETEVAEALQVSLESLQRLRADLRGLEIGSLQSDAAEDGGKEAIELVASSPEEDPYHQTLRSEMASLLERMIAELPGSERQVIVFYHFQELTMREVGALLHIGESRVSQIHTSALLRLRTRLPELLKEIAPQSKPGLRPALSGVRRNSAPLVRGSLRIA
jgi:RNA polymerase sigma factor for flagellar operon FliA